MPVSTAGSKRAIFRQVCKLIRSHLVPKLAREYDVKAVMERARHQRWTEQTSTIG